MNLTFNDIKVYTTGSVTFLLQFAPQLDELTKLIIAILGIIYMSLKIVGVYKDNLKK